MSLAKEVRLPIPLPVDATPDWRMLGISWTPIEAKKADHGKILLGLSISSS